MLASSLRLKRKLNYKCSVLILPLGLKSELSSLSLSSIRERQVFQMKGHFVLFRGHFVRGILTSYLHTSSNQAKRRVFRLFTCMDHKTSSHSKAKWHFIQFSGCFETASKICCPLYFHAIAATKMTFINYKGLCLSHFHNDGVKVVLKMKGVQVP